MGIQNALTHRGRMQKAWARSLAVFLLATMLTLAGCASGSGQNENESPDVPAVTVEEAAEMIEGSADGTLTIIDVRTPEEYALGHIAGSLNIDYYNAGFDEAVGSLDKDGSYLVYCRCGTRGASSVQIMLDQGFADVVNMSEGYLEWQLEGLPTEKSDEAA